MTVAPRAVADRPSVGTTRDATRAKAREVAALIDQKWSVAAIAERLGLSERRVRQLLSIASTAGSPIAGPDEREPATQQEAPPAPRARMTRRTLLDRAWIAMHLDRRSWTMDGARRMFWLESVATIHALGDGASLEFGDHGSGFESRAEFASAHGGSVADLEALFRRGLLLDLDGGGIGIPPNLGLKARERTGGTMAASPAEVAPLRPTRHTGTGAVPGQRSMLMGIAGGVREAPRGNSCADGEHVGGNISADDCQGTGNSSGSGVEISPAHATATTSKEKLACESGSSSTRATDGNFRFGKDWKPEGNFPGLGNLASSGRPRSGLPWLAIELAGPSGVALPLSAADLGLVQGWVQEAARLGLDTKATEGLLRGVFELVRRRDSCPEAPTLSYFDGPVQDALRKVAKTRERADDG